MRKLIWKAAAVAVFAAIGLVWAVNYASNNPQSWLGRVLQSTGQIGAKCSPLVAIRGFRNGPTDLKKTKKPEQVPVVKPAIFEPIVVEFREPGFGQFFEKVEAVPVNRREDQELPTFMPYAKEDQPKCTEQEQCAARDGSRTAVQRDESSWLWKGLVRVARYFETPRDATDGVQPAVFNVNTIPQPDGKRMPEATSPAVDIDPHHHHHSGCPYFGGYRCREHFPAATPNVDEK